MRKLILFAAIVIFASCSSDTSPAPEPAAPVVPDTVGKRWVKFWQGGDTLYSADYTTYITTFKDGDTSGIYVNGIKLYLWQEKTPGVTYIDSSLSIAPVRLGTLPMSGVVASNPLNSCGPSKYYGIAGTSSTPASQQQGICIYDPNVLPQDSSMYMSNKTLP